MKNVVIFFLFLAFGVSQAFATNVIIDISKLVERNDSAFYQDKPFTGIAVIKSANGNLVMETTYKNGLPNGLETTYYDNGTKRTEAMMKNGKYNGKVKHYYPSGQIKSSSY